MIECIFCEIISKRIPADIVYEDEGILAFLDIHPVKPGHTLVVPKEHSNDLQSASTGSLQSLAVALPQLSRAVVAAAGAAGCNIGINNGAAAGQIINHLHIHLIPRRADDGLQSWKHGEYAAGEAGQIATGIRQALT